MQGGAFLRKDLLNDSLRLNPTLNQRSIDLQLSRLVAANILRRIERGKYKLADKNLPEFIYRSSINEQSLYQSLKQQFPFLQICVWCPNVLSLLMLHVPNINYCFVDVEKDGIEPIFNALHQMGLKQQILMTPSSKECERYLTGTDSIVVRQLIGESPIAQIDNCTVPRIEKILVDAIADNELHFANGSEIYNIFANVLNQYNVNISKLMRYASRRNRKEKLQQIIQTVDYDKSKE